ncbi:MAG: 1-aminocyclopropane-1-carboxylate deaminase/D-cysteine desulfhydrase [bacterium]|nr:1-aminocyclopropane-1-carboxylate deaminase/D-cysteine desulfhydrase [bacterium]
MNKEQISFAETAGINENTPIEEINDPFLKERKISLYLKREDLNHPALSGNKWHKLKYNIQEAKKLKKNTLLTFGGAFSNHIYATAAAGKIFNFKTIGVIRGEEHLPLNPTLSFAKENGMELHYLDRTSYRRKDSVEIIESLKSRFGDFYLIPEGGTNELAVIGCSEIINKISVDFDYVCCACGTGGTLAGLIKGLGGNNNALGFAVLKGASFLRKNVECLLKNSDTAIYNNWEINLDYHFGGYAKFDSTLINFINNFYTITKIPIEPIYTGKMLYGIYDLISNGFFKRGTRIIAIHTGGLQGLKGLHTKTRATYKFEF